MFQSLLTQCQDIFCFSRFPASQLAGGAQIVGRGHSQDSWSQLTKWMFHARWCCAQEQKLEEGEGRKGG